MEEFTLENQKLAYHDCFQDTNIPNIYVDICGGNKIAHVLSSTTDISDFCSKLLNATKNICKNKYGWNVKNIKPGIDNSTTFKYLFDNWFKQTLYI
jgi:hypothetical protein